jgi:hypothetical protein
VIWHNSLELITRQVNIEPDSCAGRALIAGIIPGMSTGGFIQDFEIGTLQNFLGFHNESGVFKLINHIITS